MPTPILTTDELLTTTRSVRKRAALADLYRQGFKIYETLPIAALNLPVEGTERQATQARVFSSLQYLADHFHEVPVFVIPCFTGRVEGQPSILAASMYSSISQAGWSFMLAARARGLATCWTTIHLFFEEEAAKILDIPYGQVTQGGLITLAHALGQEFKPAPREPLSTIIHWDAW
jgi:nitroreductase